MSHPGEVMTPEVRKFIDLSMSLKEIIGISADMESGVAFERIRIYLNKRFPQLGLKPSDPIGKAIPWLEQAVLDFKAHLDWNRRIATWDDLLKLTGKLAGKFYARCVDGDHPASNMPTFFAIKENEVYEITLNRTDGIHVCDLSNGRRVATGRFKPWAPAPGEDFFVLAETKLGELHYVRRIADISTDRAYNFHRIPVKAYFQIYGTKPDKPEPEKPKTGPFGMPAREENEDDPELKALLDNINKEEKAKKPVVQQGVKPKRKTAMQEIVEEEDAKCFASMEKDCIDRAAAEEKKDRRWKYTGDGICISCKRSMYLDLEKKVCLSCFTKYRDLGKEISLAINTQKLKCLEKRISENPNGGCLYVDIVDYHTLTGCPVAQLARACGSEPQGSPSESGQDNQKKLSPEQEKAITKVANGIKKAIKDESVYYA